MQPYLGIGWDGSEPESAGVAAQHSEVGRMPVVLSTRPGLRWRRGGVTGTADRLGRGPAVGAPTRSAGLIGPGSLGCAQGAAGLG